MGASVRPERFDREAAKAAGYSDAEIDAFLGGGSSAGTSRLDRLSPVAQRSSTSTAQMDPETPTGRTLGGELAPIARQVAQGASFGAADELEAAVRAPFSDRTYGDLRDDIRGQNRAFVEENPKTAVASQLAGGLLTGGAAMRAMGMAGGAAPTAMGRIGQAAKAGAAGGGFAGAASAEGGIGDRLAGGAVGAAGGAAVGTALAGGIEAFRAATPIMRDIMNRVTTKGNTGERARRMAAQELADDGLLDPKVLQQVRDELDDMLPSRRVSLADVGGDNTRRLANTATLTPSENAGALRSELAGRQVGAGRQARTALRRGTGADGRPVVQMQDELITARQQASKPLYEEALEGVTVADPSVPKLLQRPTAAAAYRDAQRMARDAGEELPDVARVVGRSTARGAVPSMADDVAAQGDDLEATRRAWQKAQEDLATMEAYGGVAEDVIADNSRARSPYLTAAQRRKNTMANRRPTDERLSAGEKRDLRMDLTEDARGRIEDAGMTVEEYTDIMRRGQSAQRSLPGLEQRLQQAEARAGAVPSGPRPMAAVEPGDAAELPTLTGRQVQWWKLALDDQVAALEGKAGGTSTTKYRQVRALRDEVDNLLYKASNQTADGRSLYGEAQRTYADFSRQGDAVRQGARGDASRGLRSFPNADAADVEYLLKDAPDAVRVAYAKGAAAATERVVKNSRTQPAFFRAVLSDPEEQRKVRALFPKGDSGDDAFNYWLRETERDFRERLTENAVLGNSATAMRQSAKEKFGDEVAKTARDVGQKGVANTMLDRGFEWYQRQRIGEAANDVAGMFRPRSPSELQEMIDRLGAYHSQRMVAPRPRPTLGPVRAAAGSGLLLGRGAGSAITDGR